MTKKDYISLADEIRQHNRVAAATPRINSYKEDQIACLAAWLGKDSPRFDEKRWIDYINGKCGQNGGIR